MIVELVKMVMGALSIGVGIAAVRSGLKSTPPVPGIGISIAKQIAISCFLDTMCFGFGSVSLYLGVKLVGGWQ